MTRGLVSFLCEVVHAELVCTAEKRAGGIPVGDCRGGGWVGCGAARGLVRAAGPGGVFFAYGGHHVFDCGI